MVYADVDNDRIRIDSDWKDKDLVKCVPGSSWDRKEKYWHVPLSWASCKALRGIFENRLTLGEGLKAWAGEELARRIQPVEKVRELTELNTISVYDNPHDDILYPFQKAGREFLYVAGDALLADEMGSGKSIQVLAALRLLEQSGQPTYPALIVCPNSVKSNWANEMKKWLPEAEPFVLKGTITQKRKILAKAKEADRAVVITNIESMRTMSRLAPYGSIALKKCAECDKSNPDSTVKISSCEVHSKELNEFPFSTCVLDEAHRVKDMRSKQARGTKAVFHAPNVQRRWALTGTPLANHPGDLWSIMHIIAPQDFPNRSKFIDRYALTQFNVFGGMDIIGMRPDTKEEFFSFFDPRFRRMVKERVLTQLPRKVRYVKSVEMDRKQAKAYAEIADNLLTTLEDGTALIAPNNLTGALRLLQLASSYCTVDMGETPEDAASWQVELVGPSPKIDETLEIIKGDPDRPIVIAAEHARLLELTSEALGKEDIPHVMITGKVKEDERAKNLADFQEGRVNVLLFTYKAGGVGLNMTRADTMIRLQRSWSLIDNQQGEDRIHRIGSEQHDSVNIIDLITEGTIEETQVERLHMKLARLEEITRDKEIKRAIGEDVDELEAEETRIRANDFLGVQ